MSCRPCGEALSWSFPYSSVYAHDARQSWHHDVSRGRHTTHDRSLSAAVMGAAQRARVTHSPERCRRHNAIAGNARHRHGPTARAARTSRHTAGTVETSSWRLSVQVVWRRGASAPTRRDPWHVLSAPQLTRRRRTRAMHTRIDRRTHRTPIAGGSGSDEPGSHPVADDGATTGPSEVTEHGHGVISQLSFCAGRVRQ